MRYMDMLEQEYLEHLDMQEDLEEFEKSPDNPKKSAVISNRHGKDFTKLIIKNLKNQF